MEIEVMDGTVILLRTTACTLIAFCLARLLLLRIQSPRMHQVVWTLVLLQGWMVVPGLIHLSVRLPIRHSNTDELASLDIEPSSDLPSEPQQPGVHVNMKELEHSKPLPWLRTLWLLGAGGTLFEYVRRYQGLIRRIPLGEKPDGSWEDEWKREKQQLDARRRRLIQFRLTDSIGPLCCYVPFFYLVLVPRQLWSCLNSEQRASILRHELSHFTRFDLWKSLGVRVLALPQWFNPVAWNAIRAFDEAAEWACDDLVMKAYGDDNRTSYASAVLAVAETSLKPLPMSVAAGGGTLRTRIQRLVQPRFKEESSMSKFLMPLIFCGLAVLQTVRVEAQATEGDVPSNETPAPRAAARPPIALDAEGKVLLPHPIGVGKKSTTPPKVEVPKGAKVVAIRYQDCVRIADELNEFLERRRIVGQQSVQAQAKQISIIAETSSNKLILSGDKTVVAGMVQLIRKLDVRPDMVMVSLLIAETSEGELTAQDVKHCPKELMPWVIGHGRLEILSRPQIMVLNNHSGNATIAYEKDGTEHAFNVSVTPRIGTDGNITIELSVGRSKTISKVGGIWTKDEISSGGRFTTGSAETVIVSDLRTTTNENDANLVIAMTPYLIPPDDASGTVTR